MGGMLLAIAVIAVILAFIVLKVIKKVMVKLILLALNSIAGIMLFLVVVYMFGIDIPVNVFTLAITAIFGLAGIGTLIVLHFGGMI